MKIFIMVLFLLVETVSFAKETHISFALGSSVLEGHSYKNQAQKHLNFTGDISYVGEKNIGVFTSLAVNTNQNMRANMLIAGVKTHYKKVALMAGAGYTHINIHNTKRNNYTTLAGKIQYNILNGYFIGYQYALIKDVAYYDNYTLYGDNTKDITMQTLHVGKRF